jgi:hypothetical protein
MKQCTPSEVSHSARCSALIFALRACRLCYRLTFPKCSSGCVGDYVTTSRVDRISEFKTPAEIQRLFFPVLPQSTIPRLLSSYLIPHLTFMLRATLYVPFSFSTRSLATHAATHTTSTALVRGDWTKEEVKGVYDTPLLELVYRAASVHRQHHDPSKIQLCTLMNIKRELFSTRGE